MILIITYAAPRIIGRLLFVAPAYFSQAGELSSGRQVEELAARFSKVLVAGISIGKSLLTIVASPAQTCS